MEPCLVKNGVIIALLPFTYAPEELATNDSDGLFNIKLVEFAVTFEDALVEFANNILPLVGTFAYIELISTESFV